MKTVLLFLLICMAMTIEVIAQGRKLPEHYTLPEHPRLLLAKGEETEMQASIASSPVWKKMHEAILKECENMIGLPALERILVGRRLLDVSRECIRRVFFLSYAYRLTGQEKYLRRAEKEMLAVSGFSDWNPTHFISTAEMTLGMAIGYDWLNDKLSAETKLILHDAILKKGLEPSMDSRYNAFLSLATTWNQACNAGLTYGALAVADEYPEVARQIVERALKTISLPMEGYKPDGVFPEGYGYWAYGTAFNVLLLDALEDSFSTDFGLSQMPGFLATPVFRENMIGATGLCFNWGDSGLGAGLSPAMFWFASKNKDASLLWMSKRLLERNSYDGFIRDRLLPAVIIWGKDAPLDRITEPSSRVFIGQGENPVALMRTSWSNPNGIYLGFKAGSASVSHAHMDIGSFVMESDGIRWASDLGMQEYESLESKGIDIWTRTQDAQRWTVLRLNNFVHNTLTVDSQLQSVSGYAKVDRSSNKPNFPFAVSDLSPVYARQLANLTRGVGIVDESYVIVQDELKTLDKPTKVRWQMLTTSEVSIEESNRATLRKDGKQLTLRVESPSTVTLETWSTQPATTYDVPNPGSILVGFEVELSANTEEKFVVKLIPGQAEKIENAKVRSLSRWR